MSNSTTKALVTRLVLYLLASAYASANWPEVQWGFEGPGGYYGLAQYDCSNFGGRSCKQTLVMFGPSSFWMPFPAWCVAAIAVALPIGLGYLGFAGLRTFTRNRGQHAR